MSPVQTGTFSIAERADALAQAGRSQEALQLLENGAAADEPEALFALAMWRIAGQLLPRDLEAARDLFGRAAAAGHAGAAHFHIAFVTHGAGGKPAWAQGIGLLERLASRDKLALRQLEVIREMALNEAGDPLCLPPAQQLSDSPNVRVFPGLFTHGECSFLIESAIPRLQRALVIDRTTGRDFRAVERTSETTGFPLIFEDPAVHALNRRLAAASGTTAEQGEPLQVLRYSPGQEYRPHYDALPSGGNQRCQTFIVYLNEAYDGGETAFLKTDLKFKGRTGDGILFRNAHPDDTPDPASFHAGLPVIRGTKMIASRWIRSKPINLYKPLI